MRIIIALLLLVAAFCFALGITLPVIHFQKLYFFEDTPSLVSMLVTLWNDGSWLIGLAVLLFSIVFPVLKLIVVFVSAVAPNVKLAHSPISRWMNVLAKWSMMDVVLVALVIAAAKTSGLADAAAQPGIWFYAISAISGAVAAGLLKRDKNLSIPDQPQA